MAPPLDLQILRWVNQTGSPILDPIMVAASNRWLLLGIAVVAAVYLSVRSPHHWLAALLLLLSIGAADLVAVRAVKPAVDRSRPCHSLPSVRAPDGCGPGRSFPSAHAADTAAAATIVGWAAPALSPLALALTAIVGISRVYLGAHYPSDVVAGWLVGAVVAAVLIIIARLRYALRIE
jgi:membrane-associated phospholipid phosphatase